MSEYRDKLLSIGYLSGGRSGRPRVREYRDEEGGRVKETTFDGGDSGNAVHRDHARGDRRDVILRPRTIHVASGMYGNG